jgi:hypothetical protein
MIVAAHKQLGNKWAEIAKLVPGRCASAARAGLRMAAKACPHLVHAKLLLTRLIACPHRTDNAIKNRWNSTLQRLIKVDESFHHKPGAPDDDDGTHANANGTMRPAACCVVLGFLIALRRRHCFQRHGRRGRVWRRPP